MTTVAGLRIAHLIESDGPGGAERMVASLAAALQAGGAENVVFVPERGEGWLARELRGSGVRTDTFRLDRPFSPAFAARLADTLRHHRIDVAHSHEFTMAVYGAWASRRTGVPHLFTLHGSRYYAGRWRRRLALRAAHALSAATVAVSEALADQVGRDLWIRRARITTIPNGARAAANGTASLRAELGLSPEDRLAVAVGNLYPVKGHAHLLDALRLLAERCPSLHVAIAGRGELEPQLREGARRAHLSARFHLLGLRSDVGTVLAAADVFVLPSLSEGLPLALVEAMLAARPIVASAVGEIPRVLDHGAAGVLVSPGDAAALAHALAALLADPTGARRLGAAAARRAEREYSLPGMMERYAALYRRLRDVATG